VPNAASESEAQVKLCNIIVVITVLLIFIISLSILQPDMWA